MRKHTCLLDLHQRSHYVLIGQRNWIRKLLDNQKEKKWKRHQDAVYWVDIQLAQQRGCKFYQTRSNAIIPYDTLPAYCIPRAIMMETGEIIHEKVFVFPRPPPKISFKDSWKKELDSEIAGSSEDSQRIQPKNPIIKNGETRRWTRIHQGGGARHWLQRTRIVTCSCERSRTFPSSRACQKDQKSSSSKSTSSRLAAE